VRGGGGGRTHAAIAQPRRHPQGAHIRAVDMTVIAAMIEMLQLRLQWRHSRTTSSRRAALTPLSSATHGPCPVPRAGHKRSSFGGPYSWERARRRVGRE
jgi:hypothetical protein